MLINSLAIAVVSTALLLITSSMAAYAFARIEFRGKNALFVGYLATLMIPQQVLVVPLFIEMRELNLIDTYASVIVPTIASAFGRLTSRRHALSVEDQILRLWTQLATDEIGSAQASYLASGCLPSRVPALASRFSTRRGRSRPGRVRFRSSAGTRTAAVSTGWGRCGQCRAPRCPGGRARIRRGSRR